MRGIVWFREDLRIRDNNALYEACKHCDDGVIAIYLIDYTMWKKHDVADCKIDFLLRGVLELSKDLAKLNIPFRVFSIKQSNDTVNLILQQFHETNAQALFFNRQYEINETKRDRLLAETLSKHQLKCYTYDDQTILPPGSVLNTQNTYFKVFTAFKRAWVKEFLQHRSLTVPTPSKQKPLTLKSAIPITELNAHQSKIDLVWPAGEEVAQQLLTRFLAEPILEYAQQRDIPSHPGTSRLSPYLSAGMISARQCVYTALQENNNELSSGNRGIQTWISELIWRDFYKHILYAFPRVSMHHPFKIETENLAWQVNEAHLRAWQTGKTGFPIVDAAMRQLNRIGWMHNRLRMVTAMFLAKTLFLDWRLGEKYFMQHLIDGDLAANNGGWQWCASTGTDAAPYFRIFNPTRQSQRFDPNGDFIRHYCPELSMLDKRVIHDPYGLSPGLKGTLDYPEPIVDFAQTRARVIQAFKRLKTKK